MLCQGMRFEDNKQYAAHFTVGQVVEMVTEDNKAPGSSKVAIFDTKTERNLTENLDTYQTPTKQLGRRITIPDLNKQCTAPGQCVLVLTWDAEAPAAKHIVSCVDFSITTDGPLIYTVPDSTTDPRVPATSQAYGTGLNNYSQNTIPISQNTMPVTQDTNPSSQTISPTSSNTAPMSQNPIPTQQSPDALYQNTIPVSQPQSVANAAPMSENTMPISTNPDALYQNTIPSSQSQSSMNPTSAAFSNMPVANDNSGSTTYNAPYSPTTEFASKQYSNDYQSAPQVKDNISALKDVAAARDFRSMDANSYSDSQRLSVEKANAASRRLQSDQSNRLQVYDTDYNRLQGDYNSNANNNPSIQQQIALRDQTRRMQRQLEDSRKFQVDYTQALGSANVNDELKRQQDMERQLRATYEKTRNLQKQIDDKIKSMTEATALAAKQKDGKKIDSLPSTGQQKASSVDNNKDKKSSNQQNKDMAKPVAEKSTVQPSLPKGTDTKKDSDAAPPTTSKPSPSSNESASKRTSDTKATDKKEPAAGQKSVEPHTDKKANGQPASVSPATKSATDVTKNEASSKPAERAAAAVPSIKKEEIPPTPVKKPTTDATKTDPSSKPAEKVITALPVKKEDASMTPAKKTATDAVKTDSNSKPAEKVITTAPVRKEDTSTTPVKKSATDVTKTEPSSKPSEKVIATAPVKKEDASTTPAKKPITDTIKTEPSSEPTEKVITTTPVKKEDVLATPKTSDHQKPAAAAAEPAKGISPGKAVEKAGTSPPPAATKKEDGKSLDQQKEPSNTKTVATKAPAPTESTTESKQIAKDNTPKAQAPPATSTKLVTNVAQVHPDANSAAVGKTPVKAVADQGAAKTAKSSAVAATPSKLSTTEDPAKVKRAVKFFS